MTRGGRIALTVTATAALICGGAVLYIFNPVDAEFYPKCPSKLITGYDCPGCGSLRGLHALLHGEFSKAWNSNPAIFFAVFLIALIGFAGVHRSPWFSKHLPSSIVRNSGKLARITDHSLFPVLIFVTVVVWTIFRNL